MICLLLQISVHLSGQQVKITEIMADPSPGQGLPEFEYVELFAGKDIFMDGWVLEDGAGTRGTFDSVYFRSGEWKILCSREAALHLGDFDPVVVEPWPILNNGGDQLKLYDESGLLRDSVTYMKTWHDRPVEGGVSLERKIADYRCEPSRNWGSSRAADGGTPGQRNSIAEEPEPLELLNYYAGDSVLLWFNIRVDPLSVNDQTIFMNPAPDITEMRSSGSRIVLYGAIDPDLEYELILDGISACNGKFLPVTKRIFRKARPPRFGEVRINELYFNPPPGQVDYVELINTTGDVLSIASCILSYQTNKGRTDIVFLDSLVAMAPFEIYAITADKETVADAFPTADEQRLIEMQKMINMPDDRAWVRFHNQDSLLIDDVYYDHLFHHSSVTEKEGVALERIDPQRSAITRSNWMSAAFSGSPTLTNSQFGNNEDMRVWVDQRIVEEGQQLSIYYESIPPGSTATLRIFTFGGRLVETFGDPVLTGVNGEIKVDLPSNPEGVYLVQAELLLSDGRTRRFLHKIYVREQL